VGAAPHPAAKRGDPLPEAAEVWSQLFDEVRGYPE
jgi:hypothetical protein